MYHKLVICLLITILILFIAIKQTEHYSLDDDDLIDFSDPSKFIEKTQPLTPEDIKRKKELRKQLQSESQDYTPDYSGKTNCMGRCDCCWKTPTSPDRLTACSSKYKVGTPEFAECTGSNSKYAHEACKSKFGKGIWPFKTCK